MIIGLAGAKRSGKNTVAKFIAEELGDKYDVKEWSFAEDLKKSAVAALGILNHAEPVLFADWIKEEGTILLQNKSGKTVNKLSGRAFLQYYGTEAHRDIFGDNFWVDNLLWKIEQADGHANPLDVITDVRFQNEAERIKRLGGSIIKIRRDEVESSGDTHASEIPLPDELVDETILNNGSLDDLKHATELAVNLILGETK